MGIQRGSHSDSSASSSSIDPLIQKFGQLNVLDDLIRLRAADAIQYPILAYPRSKNDAASYDYFTGQDLDEMIDQTVITLIDDGFKPPQEGSIVALLALSDIRMVVTFFALSRLGYTVMMLSPRLAGDACASLLDTVGCESIIYGDTKTIRKTIASIIQQKLVTCRPMPRTSGVKTETSLLVLHRSRNSTKQRGKVALILHSSGSTGTPKPLYLTHQALMTHPLRGPGFTSFNPLPWYHLHGLSTALQAMWMRKTAYMWNAALPLTADSVVSVLEATQPESVAAVPYMLQILIDNPRGIAALRRCKLVTYGGAPCPDELGDYLVREGVEFGGSFGLTEAGLVAESISRPKGDPFWNYLKFFDNIQPYIWMKPLGNSLYECVYLSGHPALTTSNSNQPPDSFHSKDVFTPHPVIPNRWKYASRLDDRITLVNGEKVLPLPIEGHIKQHPLISEAVVFGIGKTVPGLLIFQSDTALNVCPTEDQFLDEVWQTVDRANSTAEYFSQVSRDMIAVLPCNAIIPRTDKGSMIRAQVYQQYAELIESMYTRESKSTGNCRFSLGETQLHLLQLCYDGLGIRLSGSEASFFSEGVDSLKAIQLRRLILQKFNLPHEHFLRNVVYETGTVSKLAKHICSLQAGEYQTKAEDDINEMENLVRKYSGFQVHTPVDSSLNTRSVILTGATGSIGSHTLYELLQDDSVAIIFCLTRQEHALEAIINSLNKKNISITPEQISKIIALTSTLDQPNFGLDEETMTCMRSSVTEILHVAWPVDFNLPLPQFEPHIRGLHNLIQFSLSVHQPQPAVLMFCSSVSTALGATFSEIPESPMDLNCAYMGYGRSKLIGEHIISVARQSGARAYSLRIGQVSGHSKNGLWNDSEALPLLIRSALTLKALPDLQEECSWLPVDKVAAVMVEIIRTCGICSDERRSSPEAGFTGPKSSDETIYNVCNSRRFSWSALLESLGRNGFQFEVVSFDRWIELLRESEARGEEHVNPAIKLIDHFEAMYGAQSSGAVSPGLKVFATDKAERDSITLRNGRLRIVEDGILDCYARDWISRWMKP